jgi:hypothetical protein
MHSSHHVDHQTAEYHSLPRIFDRTPMVLRQIRHPWSHYGDITGVPAGLLRILVKPARNSQMQRKRMQCQASQTRLCMNNGLTATYFDPRDPLT